MQVIQVEGTNPHHQPERPQGSGDLGTSFVGDSDLDPWGLRRRKNPNESGYGMPSANLATPPETLNWLAVGESPATIEESQADRLRRGLPYFSIGAGLLIGGLAGVCGVILVYGGRWPTPTWVELFLVIAIPVAGASSFVNRLMVPWLIRASTLHVRRVAISSGELHIEDMSGHVTVVPLQRVGVSSTVTEEGWMVVMIQAGRVTPRFCVPGVVGTTISSALSR